MTDQQIEALKQKFLREEIQENEQFAGVCSAVDLVRQAVWTTMARIHEGYLPPLTGEALNRVIAMEYLYRNTDIDNQGYNEPVCCTPFYYEKWPLPGPPRDGEGVASPRPSPSGEGVIFPRCALEEW